MLVREFDGSWTKRAWIGARALGLAAIAVGIAGFGTPAAAQNLIQNGGFETVPAGVTTGYQIGMGLAANSNSSTALPDWATANGPSSSGIGCMEYGANTGHLLCGPNYGSPASTFATYPGQSPNGGNSIALDSGNGYQVSISQLVAGLTVGKAYTLNFYQAASQQAGFAGVTSSNFFVVSFGTSPSIDSTAMSLVVQGDVPWEQQTMSFVANATSETLTFLSDNATGTSADPPFVFLDGISLVQTPEPASVGLMGLGILTLGALRRRRARRAAGSPVTIAPVSIAPGDSAAVH